MEKIEIQNLIRDLIEKTGVSVVEMTISEDSPESTWFKIEVSEPHFYVNKEGEGLQALSHLVRRIIESKTKPTEDERGLDILIDINGFQKKKIEAIHAVAHMMAERARYFKSNIEMEPMSPFERRVVHEFLSKELDLKTESVGFGPSRRLVIKYTGSL
jgi:spoIIIJ-associated protein